MPPSYGETGLDRRRLESFAKRVARETKKPPEGPLVKMVSAQRAVVRERSAGFLGLRTEQYTTYETVQQRQQVLSPYWTLFTTVHYIEEGESQKHFAYEFNERNVWALARDGGLWKLWIWDDFTLYDGFGGRSKRESDATARVMSDEDILELDREHRFTHMYRRGLRDHYRGDRNPGKVIRHAKGVGLSLALKALLA